MRADDKPETALIDPAQTHLVQELKHSSPLVGCRFDPSGRFVFAGAQDNTVQRWELDGGKRTELVGHKSWVRGLAFAPKNNLLFTGDYQGKVIAWPIDAETPAPERTLDAHRGWVRALAVSPDGQTLATCGNDHLVKLWSVPDGKPLRELAGHASHVYNLAFHPGGQFLVSIELKGVIRQWDLAEGKSVRELDAKVLYKYDETFRADIGGARSMAFSTDGSLLACGGITEVTNAFAGVGKPLVVLYDWQTGKPKQLLRPKENFQGTVWGVVFHPSGFLAGAGAGAGGALWFWRPEEPLAFFTLKLPNNARDLDLHADGRRLAVPFFDGAVRLYDMAKKPA
ncbi:MAG TPA: WD40 repeat domain-containing protein [Gemmataceae bacterium]|nr:WD40 repeat domain-containing protein [Gemmataceae bacterium]